jgi:hypothetical protein
VGESSQQRQQFEEFHSGQQVGDDNKSKRSERKSLADKVNEGTTLDIEGKLYKQRERAPP